MKFVYPLLVVLLSVWAVAPLTYPGTFQTQSGLVPVFNLMDLHAHLGASFGWMPLFGRAFDLFRNEGIFPYALAEFFRLLGANELTAIKIIFALAFVVSGSGMFAFARTLLEKNESNVADAASFLAATVYVYLPYHLAVVYVRGAFAEAVAWALFPFMALALINLMEARAPRDFALAVIAFTALFLTNLGGAILFSLFALVFVFFLFRQTGEPSPSAFREPLFAIVGALVLALLFESPALIRNRFALDANGFTPAFVLPFQLFTATWGADIPTGNFLDQFPFQLGIAGVGLALGALIFALQTTSAPPPLDGAGDRGRGSRRLLFFFLGAAGIVILLTLPPAQFVWQFAGLSLLLHAPWELLALANFALAFAAGLIVVFEQRLARPALLAAFAVIPLLTSYQYLAPVFVDFTPTLAPVAVFNDNELMLVNYKIIRPSGTIFHGATVQIEMQWQALKPVNHDYTVTFQAIDDNGKIWGQQDSKPQAGQAQTLNWTPGKIITDTHSLQVDLDGPREDYTLIVGLYTASNNQRAVTTTGATEVEIKPNE